MEALVALKCNGFHEHEFKTEPPEVKILQSAWRAEEHEMAKKGNTVIIKLRSSESEYRYWTTKNRKNTTGRIELKKYDPIIRRHVSFKEER